MSGMFDKDTIDIQCLNRHRKIPKTLGWLQTHSQITCTCKHIIPVDKGAFKRELRKVDRSIEDFKKKIKSINKRK